VVELSYSQSLKKVGRKRPLLRRDDKDKTGMIEASGSLQTKEKLQRLIPHEARKRMKNRKSTAEYSACSSFAWHDKNRYRRKTSNKELILLANQLISQPANCQGVRWPGRPRGAIGASLDFLALPFASRQKVERKHRRKDRISRKASTDPNE
jgi:hypothetical protein